MNMKVYVKCSAGCPLITVYTVQSLAATRLMIKGEKREKQVDSEPQPASTVFVTTGGGGGGGGVEYPV